MHKNNLLCRFSSRMNILNRYYGNRWDELILRQSEDLARAVEEFNTEVKRKSSKSQGDLGTTYRVSESKCGTAKEIVLFKSEVKRSFIANFIVLEEIKHEKI
ncbi:hypothetical protein HWI79_47 [Cryptosporidium felis]|nr:hypothetical protein HWI79_47 [Cryptosporidium felis]